MANETFFKIRDKTSGLFSTGGSSPGWSDKGKKWSHVGHVTNHLNNLRGHRAYGGQVTRPYANAELVEFEAVPITGTEKDISLIRAEAKERRDKKEARAAAKKYKKDQAQLAAQAVQNEARERRRLAELKAKYPDP
jgi:hypothetical protein